MCGPHVYISFFFNDTATPEIYTLSLHDALPISPLVRGPLQALRVFRAMCPDQRARQNQVRGRCVAIRANLVLARSLIDRKSTRLNSSHDQISYAVFCLKKKKVYRSLATARMHVL